MSSGAVSVHLADWVQASTPSHLSAIVALSLVCFVSGQVLAPRCPSFLLFWSSWSLCKCRLPILSLPSCASSSEIPESLLTHGSLPKGLLHTSLPVALVAPSSSQKLFVIDVAKTNFSFGERGWGVILAANPRVQDCCVRVTLCVSREKVVWSYDFNLSGSIDPHETEVHCHLFQTLHSHTYK